MLQIPMTPARPRPRGLWIFAAAMSVALATAAFGGLVLGILAATNHSIAQERWSEVVQAHGDLQLWGWFAVFTAALGMEFIVRLNRRMPVAAGPRLAVLALLSAGAIVSASGRVVGHLEQPLAMGGAALLLVGASGFAAIILRVPAMRPLRTDLHPLFFRVGAGWLVVSALCTLIAASRMTFGVVPLDESYAIVDVFLRGFLVNVVVAVALRAFPGHLELPPMDVRSQRVLFVLLNAGLVLWVAGSSGFGLPGIEVLQRIGDLSLVAVILLATVGLGVRRTVGGWSRSVARTQVMIPVAWIGLLAYAAALTVRAVAAEPYDTLALFQTGAVRHIFMFGFIAPLMIAMAHVVLHAFGTDRVYWENRLTAAFVLLVIAWPLRVVPPLVDGGLGDGARGMMGAAGVLAIVALALAAGVTARNAVAIRRHLH